MFANQQKVTLTLVPLALSLAILGGCTTTSTVDKEKTGTTGEKKEETKTETKAASGNISIDGSSTVFPISEKIAEDFGKANPGKRAAVATSGTGGGFKKFCRGEIDISNASRPILQKEIDACKEKGIEFLEIPIAYDAITVVINPANTWAKTMKVEDLKKMWGKDAMSKVKTWKDVNPSFPDAKLTLFGPGSASGTFDYFTEAMAKPKKDVVITRQLKMTM
jgi:phosphate transport system substrate-binding protein